MKIREFFFGLAVSIAAFFLSVIIRFGPEKARTWIIKEADRWSQPVSPFRYNLAARLQEAIARALGLKRCLYCGWVLIPGQPGQPHDYCEQQASQDFEVCVHFEFTFCQRCQAPTYHGEEFCPECEKQILAETKEMWDRQREAEDLARESWDEEHYAVICPCGHRFDQHYGDGQCSQCDCPRFGTPVEEWEPPTEVNLGDDPGGFKIYE